MSDATLRVGIATILTEVPGTGMIHNYERLASTDEKFISLFMYSGKIMGWEIVRVGVILERQGAKVKVTHSYQIRGYYGVQDAAASELAFNAIVDAVLAALMAKQIPGSSIPTLPRVNVIQPKMFGGILCHYAEIAISVPEVVTPTSAEDEDTGDLLRVGMNYYLKPGDDVADATDLVTLNT